MKIPEYDPKKCYSNEFMEPDPVTNYFYYLHDIGYKFPKGRTRVEVDRELFNNLKSVKRYMEAYRVYSALRLFGFIRWNELRKKYG